MIHISTGHTEDIGAQVRVRTRTKEQVYYLHSGGSYASQSDLRVTVGLGTDTQVDEVEVRWPRGRTTTYRSLPVDRQIDLREGDNVAAPAIPAPSR